jgi:hypothetical protein
VNEEEFADTNKVMVHVDGNLGQDSIAPIYGKPLNEIYVKAVNDKIDELKETTGNRDVSNGGTTGGVTAASGMAAMMEAGAKLDRDGSKAAYRAFRKIIHMVIENIRQFYDAPRAFRIIGDNGAQEFVNYSNAGIAPQYQGMDMGVDMGYRLPQFDIEISAQKASPYSKMAQNELALQFFRVGFFNPQLADQALATLEMMDFERKDFIMQRIAQNAMQYQQSMMMGGMMGMPGMAIGGMMPGVVPEAPQEEPSGGESSVTRNARERVAESGTPT